MAVALSSLRTSAAQPQKRTQLPVLRSDLEIVPQYWRGELIYIVKDPVRFHYFRISEAEYFVLQNIRTPVTMDDLRARSRRVLGYELEERDIQQFIRHLAVSNLLASRGLADAERFTETARKRRRMMLYQWFANYLFIRLPVWDPDRILDRIYPWFRWMFSPVATAVWVAFVLLAFYIVATNFGTLTEDAFSLLSGWNLLILSIAIFATKFVHEMGHALFCKHYGGECHEMGFALLVFNPCMYVDTTDAWRFPSKWARVAVGAAGMLSEIFLAAVFAFIWVMSDPGWWKTFAYSVMVTCSVSTILFNANPLLRYDGYYMLSDYLEIPNFRNKTIQYLSYVFKRYILGIRADPVPMTTREKWIYMVYGVAAWLYRWIVVIAITFVLFRIFPPLGVIMLISSVYGQVLMPVGKGVQEVFRNVRSGKVRTRLVLVLAAVLAALVGIWFIPVNYKITGPCEVVPAVSKVIRAPVDGRVEAVLVKEGDTVEEGQVLVRIVDEDLQAQVQILESRLEGLRRRKASALAEDMATYQMIEAAEKSIEHEIALSRKKLDEGTVRAPFAGTVCLIRVKEVGERHFAHPQVQAFAEEDTARINEFYKTEVNIGNGLMQIAKLPGYVLRVYVRQDEIAYIGEGQKIEAVLAAFPYDELKTQVKDVAPTDARDIDNPGVTQAGAGGIPTRADVRRAFMGGYRPLMKFYQITAQLGQDVSETIRWGMTGKARVYYGRGPFGQYWAHKIYKALRGRVQRVM